MRPNEAFLSNLKCQTCYLQSINSHLISEIFIIKIDVLPKTYSYIPMFEIITTVPTYKIKTCDSL